MDIQKSINLSFSTILQNSIAALQDQQQLFEPKTFTNLGIDAVTVLEKAIQLIPPRRKDESKPTLNEEIGSLSDHGHTPSDYLFGENMSKSL